MVKVKIEDYFYYDNFSDNVEYNSPVLVIVGRDKDTNPHFIQILDKKNLMPKFGVLKNEADTLYNYREHFGKYPKYIIKLEDAPDSMYGESVVNIFTNFPFEVTKIRNDFSRTFQGDVKWEKMAMSKLIKLCGLVGPYIEIPNDYIYRFLEVKDIKGIPKEDLFAVLDRICYWDIETDSRGYESRRIQYEDYKNIPVLSISDYDNYEDVYYIVLWHPNFLEDQIRTYNNYKIKDRAFKDREVIVKKLIVHEVTSEDKLLKAFFSHFGNVKFDRMFGYWSTGGLKRFSSKGVNRKKWFDGFDIQSVYSRTKQFGLLEEMQKMSVCPLLKKRWGNDYEGAFLRTGDGKHQVIIQGVGQLDFVISNEWIQFAQKYYNFRGHRLADWMEYFLSFNKLDKGKLRVWQYWLQKDCTDEDLASAEVINGVPRVEGKGLQFMIDYNIIDVYGVVELDKFFKVSKNQAGRTEVSISPFADALEASKLHDHYKLTNYQDQYSFDSKYESKSKREPYNIKDDIGEQFTIKLKDLEDQARKRGKDVTYNTLKDIGKIGGFVPQPVKKDIYYYVLTIDFSKFYPNMIKSTNAGIETAINLDRFDDKYVWDKNGKRWNREDLIETPITFFRKDIKSINSDLFDDWMEKRVSAQKKVKLYVKVNKTTKTDKYKLLWSEQFNIKNFMNAGFGVMGLPIDRTYSLLSFNACTVSCQDVIMFVIKKLVEWKIKVLGGDTDSTFIKGKGKGKELEKYGKDICDKLNEEIKNYMWKAYNIHPDNNYIKIGLETISSKFYVDTKKHYVKLNSYAEGVWLDKLELEVKGMELKKRNNSQLGADVQNNLIDILFSIDDPINLFRDYILKIEDELQTYSWGYVCKRGALNKDLESYPDSNESATAARNSLKYLGRYYEAGSNPFIGVFKKYPSQINGKFLNCEGLLKMSFDEEDEVMLKDLGFELDYDVIRQTQCQSSSDHILEMFDEDWYSLKESGELGDFLDA